MYERLRRVGSRASWVLQCVYDATCWQEKGGLVSVADRHVRCRDVEVNIHEYTWGETFGKGERHSRDIRTSDCRAAGYDFTAAFTTTCKP